MTDDSGMAGQTTPAQQAAAAAKEIGAMASERIKKTYNEDMDFDHYGCIRVNLKGTREVTEEAKGFFRRLFVGDKTYEEEAMDKAKFLTSIYGLLSSLRFKNVVSLDLNGETVYEDQENTPDDFEKAIKLALEKHTEGPFKVCLNLDITGDEESDIIVTMDSRHDVGTYPLMIEVMGVEETNSILEQIRAKIGEFFEVEDVEVEPSDEPEEDEPEKEDSAEEEDGSEEGTDEDEEKR